MLIMLFTYRFDIHLVIIIYLHHGYFLGRTSVCCYELRFQVEGNLFAWIQVNAWWTDSMMKAKNLDITTLNLWEEFKHNIIKYKNLLLVNYKVAIIWRLLSYHTSKRPINNVFDSRQGHQ